MTDGTKTTICLSTMGVILTPVFGWGVWLVFVPAIALNIIGAVAIDRLQRR